jgi:hypothetical protein
VVLRDKLIAEYVVTSAPTFPISVKLWLVFFERSTLKPVSLSELSVHDKSICDDDTVVAARFVGAAGIGSGVDVGVGLEGAVAVGVVVGVGVGVKVEVAVGVGVGVNVGVDVAVGVGVMVAVAVAVGV